MLSQRVHKTCRGHLCLVDLAFQKEVAGERSNGSCFGEFGSFCIGEVRDKISSRACYKLCRLLAGSYKHGSFGIKVGGESEQVTIKGPTQAFVSPDEDDGTPADLAMFKQRVMKILHTGRSFALNAI